MARHQQLIFLELNEVNFHYLEAYIEKGQLPNFKKFFDSHGYAETTSEKEYKELEPWIQWVTAHTGQSFAEHQIFRLGDAVNFDPDQIWEQLEAQGLKVGAISPMNAKYRLKDPAFFVPDPWTRTTVVADPVVKRLYDAIAQAVNDNAESRITARSLFNLALGGAATASPGNYFHYLRYVKDARQRPWTKALFLDQLLADLFIKSVKKHNTDFATLFLNAAAHIQHHYMFSSSVYDGEMRNPEWYVGEGMDPIFDVYDAYDRILGEVIKRFPDARIMLGTGLHQDPHPTVTYYWRIKDHAAFLNKIGVPFSSVEPRMSRDFLIKCATKEEAATAEQILLASVANDGVSLFTIDNRGTDLFVELEYPHEITDATGYRVNNQPYADLRSDVAFVAIKNGEHNGIGYFADTHATAELRGAQFPLSDIPQHIRSAFDDTEGRPKSSLVA